MSAYWMHDMSWGWGVLMMVGALAFWLLVIGLLTNVWRGRPRDSAAEILHRRLAAGEITVEEYDVLREAVTR